MTNEKRIISQIVRSFAILTGKGGKIQAIKTAFDLAEENNFYKKNALSVLTDISEEMAENQKRISWLVRGLIREIKDEVW